MALKLIVLFSAFLVQSALSNCIGRGLGGPSYGPGVGLAGQGLRSGHGFAGNGLGLAGSGLGFGGQSACGSAVASTGGGFPVRSSSPVAPTGVSVVSENAIEGALKAGGNLPLLGSVSVEGAFPTEGAGAISYGCGDGAVDIESEGPIDTGILAPGAVAPAPAVSVGSSLSGPGFGLAGSGFGIAGNGLGRAGSGFGLARSGLGLSRGLGLGAGCNGFGFNGLGRGIQDAKPCAN